MMGFLGLMVMSKDRTGYHLEDNLEAPGYHCMGRITFVVSASELNMYLE